MKIDRVYTVSGLILGFFGVLYLAIGVMIFLYEVWEVPMENVFLAMLMGMIHLYSGFVLFWIGLKAEIKKEEEEILGA